MTPDIQPGDLVKARFWRGERVWATVEAVNDGSLDARLANEPVDAGLLNLKWGDPVSCGLDEVLEHRPRGA